MREMFANKICIHIIEIFTLGNHQIRRHPGRSQGENKVLLNVYKGITWNGGGAR